MKRSEEEKHENSERWLLTYSDMITLLLVLFIMMYTISKVDTDKFEALAYQLGITLGAEVSVVQEAGDTSDMDNDEWSGLGDSHTSKPEVSSPQASTAAASQQVQGVKSIQDQIQELVDEAGIETLVGIHTEQRGVVVSLKEALLFNSGSADVNKEGQEMLKKMSGIFTTVDNYISVEGSADNVPISSARYASNWELASQRAINVAKLLQSYGVDPARLSSTSYGEYRPVAPNDSEENKERNRRVDIVIIDKDLNEYQPGYENAVE